MPPAPVPDLPPPRPPLAPPGRGALPVRRAVAAHLATLPPSTEVVVACSGGPDSLALLAALADLTRPHGPHADLRPRVLHVDHALRPGSAAEGAWVVATAHAAGLSDAHTTTVSLTGPGGPEAAARAARRSALAAHAGPGADILLGHTADDQAETVLLALGRGAGLTALAGMAPQAALPGARAGVRLVRPLLGLRRADTVAACAAYGLTPLLDPTNHPEDSTWRAADGSPLRRAAVRHRALPALAQALGLDPVPALARTAAQVAADAAALDELAAGAYTAARAAAADQGLAAAPGDEAGAAARVIRLDLATLAAQPAALRTRVLARAGQAAGWRAGAVTARHLAALDRLCATPGMRGPLALPGARAWRAGRAVVVAGGGL
ncbi:MAG: tRNA lysidine(34) synthetase TilS [Buchananella hordeovulneris]|nr:tRNA lysidine(34) synthetase TilS [Buchananella hordeovulneris]